VWSDVSLRFTLYQDKKYHPAFKTFSNIFSHNSRKLFQIAFGTILKNVFGGGAVGGFRDAFQQFSGLLYGT
jgi:hypothetical protein